MKAKITVVLGASPNPSRYSNIAVKSLLKHDIPVIPVGKRKGKAGGLEIIRERPLVEDVHTVTMYIGPAKQKDYYTWLLSLHPSRIIFNPGTENEEFMGMAKKEGIEVVEDCTLLMLNAGRY